jgi:adenylate cyclase
MHESIAGGKMNAPGAFEFGPFRVDGTHRLLTCDGEAVVLAPKPFSLLLYLLRHSGQTLSKEQLIAHLWTDSTGSEANLSVNIAAVRRALGERPRDHRYVVTVPLQGYAFVAEVRQTGAQAGPSSGGKESVEAAPAKIRLLAVLPFHISHPAPGDDHLGPGFADTISSRIPPLQDWAVQAPHTVQRLATAGSDPLTQGRQVDAVLSGMIDRGAARLVVSVRLNLTEDGSVFWGDTYIISVEGLTGLPRRIAEDLARVLGMDHPDPQDTANLRCSENLGAFQEYLKGRFLMEKGDGDSLRASIDHFHRALELDPGFGIAQACMAGTYYRLWRLGQSDSHQVARDLETAARRALELDNSLADPYFWLANLNMVHHWNWPVARALFQRGLERAPNSSLGHTLYAYFLALAGRPEEAVAEARLGQALEPTNLFATSTIANILRVTGQGEAAANQFETVLRMAPDFMWGHVLWGWTLLSVARYEPARERFLFVKERAGEIGWVLSGLSFALAKLGDLQTARALVAKLREMASRDQVEPLFLAFAYFGLDDREQTLRWLEESYLERNPLLVYQRLEPVWGSFHDDPGFRAIFDRIGAPSL